MTLIYFIIALGILVTIHELGHLIMAKRNGIRVEAFSIGFGPKIFSFRYGETEYKISIIPLGGYVKMLGENPEDEGFTDAHSYAMQSVWARLKVVVAGPIMNILLCALLMPPVFMIGRLEPTYLKRPPVVERVKSESPAALAGLQSGDLVTEVDREPVKNWRSAIDRLLISGGKPLQIVVNRNSKELSFSVTPVTLPQGQGFYIGVEPFIYIGNDPVINKVMPDTPAATAGLEADDRVVSINDHPVESWTEMTEIINRESGNELSFGIRRHNKEMIFSLTPRFDESVKRWVIGVQKDLSNSDIDLQRVSYGLTGSFKRGYQEFSRLVTLTFEVLRKLFTLQLSYKSLGGPIQIAQASAMAAQNGLADFIHFLGFLSLQLGILNLLPIPVLDGGHVVFLAIESIRRKPLSIKVQVVIQQVGLALLLLLFLMVTVNDLENVWGLKMLISKWF